MTTNKILIFLFLSIFSLFATAIIAQPQIPDAPQPARYMVDMANMLTPEEAQSIEDKLYAYYKAQQAQIIIVTVVSLDGSSVEEYAEALFKKWGIGDKERKDGALLLISKNDRKMRLEVGYGLEATLTDAFAADIINLSLKPNFKNNDFYTGINAATIKIINKLSPNYNIPKTTIDSTRAAAQKEVEITQVKADAEAGERNWFILKIFFFIIALAIGLYLWQNWANKRKTQAALLDLELDTCRIILEELQHLKQSEAYKDINIVRDFIDNYYTRLNELVAHLQAQDIKNTQELRTAQQPKLFSYRVFTEYYQAFAAPDLTSKWTANPKYYPAEARRVCEASRIEMMKISHTDIMSLNKQNNIVVKQPQVKFSIHYQSLFDALISCPVEAQKRANIAILLLETFEESKHFELLIEKTAQSELFLDSQAKIISDFVQKIYDICLECHNIISDIKNTTYANGFNASTEAVFIAVAAEKINDILKLFVFLTPPKDENYQIDYAAISTVLKNPTIDKQIIDFPKQAYSQPFAFLTEKLNEFCNLDKLKTTYKDSYTDASIAALYKGLSNDIAYNSSNFKAGKYAAAYKAISKIFNGIFSTKKYLNNFLVPIASRSYSNNSTNSSHTASYSDYTPPTTYSDYTPPAYSDYSDYKDYSDYSDSYSDSSYGGGSSGGGGASGDW